MRKPVVVKAHEATQTIPFNCAADGFRVKRLITRSKEGSERILLGLLFIEPHSTGYSWSFPDKDEAYYIMSGRVLLRFESQQIEAAAGDAIFLPSCIRYEMENAGPEMVVLVYAMSPPGE